MISKPAKVIALEEEIVYANSQLQPHDTGHIHTAIGWMERRVEVLSRWRHNRDGTPTLGQACRDQPDAWSSWLPLGSDLSGNLPDASPRYF